MPKTDRPNPRAASAVDRQIGARIKARRLDMGMSQEKLGDIIGVTFQQIQKYEKGVNRVAASTLMEIAGALELKPEALLPRGGSGSAEISTLDDPDAQQIVLLFGRLNAEGKRVLTKVARSLATDDQLKAKDRR